MRAGRESAEDVKRRMLAACKEAGLAVQASKFYLRHEYGDRVIQVGAVTPEGPCQKSAVDILAVMSVNGDWSGNVKISCSAVDDDVDPTSWDFPIMQGREAVPLEDLVEHLRKTLEEREQVVAAVNMGVPGPYHFEESCWDKPLDITGIP